MAYATLAKVHERLNIADSITAPDAKIASYILESDGYTNNQIALHATVPIPVPDDQLIALSNALATAIYRFYNSKHQNYKPVEDAKKDIAYYIRAVYARTNADGLGQVDVYGIADGSITGLETS